MYPQGKGALVLRNGGLLSLQLKGPLIMYMKIVTEGMARHLCMINQRFDDTRTLCGATVTQNHSWKRIRGLEGDECQRCADLAFDGYRSQSSLSRIHLSEEAALIRCA